MPSGPCRSLDTIGGTGCDLRAFCAIAMARPYQNEPIWLRSETAIARTAFDVALGQDLHEVIREAKRMANEIQKSSDLSNLEHPLTQRRKRSIANTTFAVRDLPDVLGRPLYENRLSEEDLRGLREDKRKPIR